MKLSKFIALLLLIGLIVFACKRDEIRPDHFVGTQRLPALDSLLNTVPGVQTEFDHLLLPDGGNLKAYLEGVNPDLDSLFPRNGNHPFYELQGDELKDLLIGYMMTRAANAYNIVPGQYPGNGDAEPEQDKLGYAAGSIQTDLRTPGVGSLSGCPQIFGLDESGFIRHIMEGAYLTLASDFHPFYLVHYNEALGITGLSQELEFVELLDLDEGNILAGDIFVMYTQSGGNDYFHYGIVLNSSDNPDELMLADCFADVAQQDCKTDIGISVGPRLVSLTYLLGDLDDVTDVEYKVMRLKKKLYLPYTEDVDMSTGLSTVRIGAQVWMRQDAVHNGFRNFTWEGLGLETSPNQGICPNGWHVPTKDEWDQLLRELNAQPYPWPQLSGHLVQYYPGIAQHFKNTTWWPRPGTNLTNFTVQPHGYIEADLSTLGGYGVEARYWTASESGPDGAYSIIFEDAHDDVLMDPADLKTLGYRCRCVRDLPSAPTGCLKIPIVFHFLKCSQNPIHRVNNLDISTIYDQVAYLNNTFQFNDYCIEFYLACRDEQAVFEVHDICDGTFTGMNATTYLNPVDSLKYTSDEIMQLAAGAIQSSAGFEWDPARFLNVYIAETGDGAIASFPGSAPETDCIIMPVDWIGGTQVAYDEFNDGRTMSLAHEIGHSLELHHPWIGADFDSLWTQGGLLCPMMNNPVADVTKIYGNPFADTVYSCNAGMLVRNDNIMSYGDYGVAIRFTPGQKSHMHSVLLNTGPNGRAGWVRQTRECQ